MMNETLSMSVGETYVVIARSSNTVVQAWAASREEAEQIASAFRAQSPDWRVLVDDASGPDVAQLNAVA